MAQLNIHASPLPFSTKRVKVNAPVGSTVQEIVDQICPENLKDVGVGAIVMINGEAVLQRHWKRIRPKEGTIINVRIVPTGGGGKNPLATLLSVVVMIAAPYAGAAFGTSLGLGVLGNGVLTAGQTAFFNGLVTGAVGIVGRMLVNALAPPPKPSNLGGTSNPAESPTLFIEGARNVLDPFGVVPINLGINRMIPKKCGRSFTESQDNTQYIRELFSWGVGDKLVISNLKIGETDIGEFDGVEMQHRLNGDLDQGTGLYPNDPFQEDFSVLLQEVDGYTTRQTQDDCDEAIVDFTFFNGLAEFNKKGKRIARSVQLEMQYADASVSPSVWSPAVDSYTAVSSFSDTVDAVPVTSTVRNMSGTDYYVGYRKDVVVIDKYSTAIFIINGTQVTDDPATVVATPPAAPAIPENCIRLGSALVRTRQAVSSGVTTTTIESFTDDRQSSLFGTTFEDSGDFVPSNTGTTVNVTAGALSVDDLNITASQTEALRISRRVVFPARGTYLIRVRRVSDDTDSDQILDKVSLTAIKSFTYQQPVEDENVNGTAMRIKGTNQLNGTVDQFNAIVSSVIPDYDAATDTWVERISNNPASLYLYVLQGAGNKRPLADAKINFDDLKDWHAHCLAQGYTYNRVIDYETSVDEVLRDIAAAGSASPAIVDGKRTIVIDRVKDDVVQIVTPRNSWGYSGEMTYPDVPHAFRVQFRNKEKGYQQDERIVYDDGYNEDNATIFETLELQSCTDADLAFKTARRHIATARLRPETHSFIMDIENLVCLRGDRIKLAHDVPIIAVGDARVKSVTMDGGSPNLVAALEIDDTITIPSAGDYYVRVRLQDGTMLYKELTTSVGSTKTLTFAEPFARPMTSDSPAEELLQAGDLLYVVEAGGEVDLIITKIEPQDDLTARITALDYAPDIFDAENATIPSWSSRITTPLEFIRPLPPVLLASQSDESAMIRNSDGSFTSRAIFTLENPNEGDLVVMAQVRISGTEFFVNANLLEATTERLVITGLQDNTNYDIHIRYKRVGSNVMSTPLQLNGYLFVGAGTIPADVSGFKINVTGENALFSWTPNTEIDIDHYVMKYSGVYSGATWATAQIIDENLFDNHLTLPFQGGTYLIKAVDILGNESENATVIITYDASALKNVVETLTENPDFNGTKDNVVVEGTGIVIADTDLTDGYYYFDQTIDLSAVFVSFVSASILANGTFVNDIFDIVDVFDEEDIFGAGGNDLFAQNDIFAMDDVFGIGSDGWSIELQYRVTDDDPSASPSPWGDWQTFVAGNISFRAIQFRLKMTSLAASVSPKVTQLSVTVDMPDRIERGEDLLCDATGSPAPHASVTYSSAFKNNPSVAITLQDGAVDDRIEFTAKTPSGFAFRVYNETTAGYVSRSYDFIASGYGREDA